MKVFSREEYERDVLEPAIRKWSEGVSRREGGYGDWMRDIGSTKCSFCNAFIHTQTPCPIKAGGCIGGCSVEYFKVHNAWNIKKDYSAYRKASVEMLKHVMSCDYDYYLSLVGEQEKKEVKHAIEPSIKEELLDVDRLYMWNDGLLIKIIGIKIACHNYYNIEEIISGRSWDYVKRDLLIPATRKQIEEAYAVELNGKKEVFFEEESGYTAPQITLTNKSFKELLAKAGVKYVPYKCWKNAK